MLEMKREQKNSDHKTRDLICSYNFKCKQMTDLDSKQLLLSEEKNS